MTSPLGRKHRIVGRGEAGVSCDEDGIALGAVHLVRASRTVGNARYCEVRSQAEIDQILRAAYGPQPAGVASRIHRGLCRAARWIEAGDLGRAGVETVGLGLPDIGLASMAKLAEIADLEKGGDAWRNEPRVPAGQGGGGQWTADGAGSPMADAKPVGNEAASSTSDCANLYSFHPLDNGLLVHVNTAAVAVGGFGAAEDVVVPAGALRLGGVGLLAANAVGLQNWRALEQQKQIKDAIARFGLDPSRPAEVMAASAYVWSTYHLPTPTNDIPYNGPVLDAASQAVMRLVLIHPDVFVPVLQGQKPSNLIIQAANAGMADYVYQSARPKGVDRKYQTTSASARAAVITETELNKDVAVHHFIPANVWKDKLYLVELAYEAGWRVDDPDNLIDLPRDPVQQARMGGFLPIHNGSHSKYDDDAMRIIEAQEAASSKPITPVQAREIFTNVCCIERIRITSGYYGEFVRVGA